MESAAACSQLSVTDEMRAPPIDETEKAFDQPQPFFFNLSRAGLALISGPRSTRLQAIGSFFN